ncbi:MAG TPA: DUF3011 domain-containing protein [Longimicrobium sp.]|jgi:hypothetical protein
MRKTSLALSALAIAGALTAAHPAPAAAQRLVTCQSYDGRTNHCRVDTRGGVRLVRRLSEASCSRGRTWGTDRGGIWVSRGCRAQFAVGERYGDRDRWDDRDRDRWDDRDRDRWDDRDRGRWDDRDRSYRARAEQVCRAAVRDRVRGARSGRIQVDYASGDRRGNSLVRWRTSRAYGTCRVDRYNRLVDFDRRG